MKLRQTCLFLQREGRAERDLSPVLAKHFSAGRRAGVIEGGRTALAGDSADTAVSEGDVDAGRGQALRQDRAGRLLRRSDLEGDGAGDRLPGRVVPPAAVGLPRVCLAAE